MSVEPIRVELESFCQQFTAALEPFSESLDTSTETLRQASSGELLQSVLSDLQDNRHRLKILLDKARQQNTYLVIFGPLKSGKSTLMNAISGAYVSEVSSLPAYPCLVYVREGESHGFSTTAFNGDRQEYASHEALHSSLEKAHEALADRLRKADAEGQPFNPAQDFTEAIRRIDFTMAAPYLRESGTILVDTPGLYTKMKYSYGQLTRDFRDTAACAVFVVKTDNLFFEQVFEEFADLLDVFSRVFLVVNIDSSKQDLGPDGKPKPSLEQRDPKRIIEAFENLTVSAQIRSAIDSGRLRIYMIDLLQTAMRSLQGSEGDETSTPAAVTGEVADASTSNADEPTVTEEGDSSPTSEQTEPAGATTSTSPGDPLSAAKSGPRMGFEHFLEDLTGYLNSSEYIVEFMGDSLRQARTILNEVRECAKVPEIVDFREGIDVLEAKLEETRQHLQSLEAIRKQPLDSSLETLTKEIHQQVTEHSGAEMPKLEQTLEAEVNAWVSSDESMRDLVQNRVSKHILEFCTRTRSRAIELFDRACQARNGGLQISDEVTRKLAALEISFNEIYSVFQPTVRERLEAEPTLASPTNLQDALPLRKRFIDWLLFRNEARLRRRILGNENPSERPIPAAVKGKRLDEEGLRDFSGKVSEYARRCSLEALEGELETLLREYREAFQLEARQRFDTRQKELREEHDESGRQLNLLKAVLRALDELESASDKLDSKVVELREQFVRGKYSPRDEDAEAIDEAETVENTGVDTEPQAPSEERPN